MEVSKTAIALTVATSSLLTACSDNDSASLNNTDQGQYSITAIDGYLKNAKVWLDINHNFEHDPATEPVAYSNDEGVANLELDGFELHGLSPQEYPVVVAAIANLTEDLSNPGQTVTSDFLLSAPIGEDTVTPLSTLVHLHITQNFAAGTDTTKEEAVSHVANTFNLSPSQVLGDYIASNDGSSEDNETLFIAENIVASHVLNLNSQQLEQLANTPTGESELDEKLTVVSDKIQHALETTGTESPVYTEQDFTQDDDGDGVINVDDLYPNDSSKAGDPDNDGVDSILDLFPYDPTEHADNDLDEIGDNADTDDDNDGISDDLDEYPYDISRAGDPDGDGYDTLVDAFPNDSTEWQDSDKDNVGDNQDLFDDDPTEWSDFDQDGVGDTADLDDDNDGYPDLEDQFPNDEMQAGDNDNDGIDSVTDNCPFDANPSQSDMDEDGIGDACDSHSQLDATWNQTKWNQSNWQ